MTTSNECLANDCQKEEYARGLCRSHYQLASRAVRQQITTWERLEEEGLSAPEKKRGPAPSPFTQAVEATGRGGAQ